MKIIGLMSGTSIDGLDIALCEVGGAPPRLDARIIHAMTIAYPPVLRERIMSACDPNTSRVDDLCVLHVDLAHTFTDGILTLLAQHNLSLDAVDLIASHGQTVWHNVLPDGSVNATLQIVEASVLAQRTGITTISNFRARDVAAGGQGAPLTGYVDWLLLRHQTAWRAVQNIGGMGNVTFLPPLNDTESLPIAFDTGPGNALLDVAMQVLTDGKATFDADGALAAQGQIDSGWLDDLMAHPFLRRQPPRTTGRELFGTAMAEQNVADALQRGLTPPDIMATLTAFTAHSIAHAYEHFAPLHPAEIILGGGGRYNRTLVMMLRDLLHPAVIRSHESLNIASDHKEALVFAVLAYETWHNRPGTLPSLTGVSEPVIAGQITPGKNYARLQRALWRDD